MFKNKKLNSFHQSLNKFGEKIDKLEYSLKNANETINFLNYLNLKNSINIAFAFYTR